MLAELHRGRRVLVLASAFAAVLLVSLFAAAQNEPTAPPEIPLDVKPYDPAEGEKRR
jgi:hypothetical protein